jgi:hypothetical protein
MDQTTINGLEKSFLENIVGNLKSKKLTLNQARIMAKDFMNLLPFKEQNDLKTKIKNFSEKYIIFSPLYITLLKNEETTKMNNLLNKMRSHMKEKNIDEALKIANQ